MKNISLQNHPWRLWPPCRPCTRGCAVNFIHWNPLHFITRIQAPNWQSIVTNNVSYITDFLPNDVADTTLVLAICHFGHHLGLSRPIRLETLATVAKCPSAAAAATSRIGWVVPGLAGGQARGRAANARGEIAKDATSIWERWDNSIKLHSNESTRKTLAVYGRWW